MGTKLGTGGRERMRRRVGRGKRVEHSSVQTSCLRPVAQSFLTEYCHEVSSTHGVVPCTSSRGLLGPALRFPSPELYSRMWSLSERASHLSFISCLLDITCCNFSRICGEERGEAQAMVMLPDVCSSPRRLQRASGVTRSWIQVFTLLPSSF